MVNRPVQRRRVLDELGYDGVEAVGQPAQGLIQNFPGRVVGELARERLRADDRAIEIGSDALLDLAGDLDRDGRRRIVEKLEAQTS
ncbi:MAG TPA: hypothetical protein VJY33_12465 [Isosphaeraceae bacterium]|nr:hypothetical protein [Isosphaeraceae bacterium]